MCVVVCVQYTKRYTTFYSEHVVSEVSTHIIVSWTASPSFEAILHAGDKHAGDTVMANFACLMAYWINNYVISVNN